MKHTLFAVALLLVCQCLAVGQQSAHSAKAWNMLQESKARRAITAVHERSTQALIAADARGITESFAAAFSTAGGDYQFESRDELMRGVKSGDFKFQSIKNDISDVRVTGNTAVVTSRRSVKATIKGKEFDYQYTLKSVYVMEQGKWKALLWAVVNC